jgi:gluconokinase
VIVIIMGVTGAGKTTIGSLLAQRLGWQFADADDFHPPANIEKMRQGVPLTDADRTPWLTALRGVILRWTTEKRNFVLACSALKRGYRTVLLTGAEVKFVYLKGSSELLNERLMHRHGHFATNQILASQFASLEEPTEEAALIVDVKKSPQEIVIEILERLQFPADGSLVADGHTGPAPTAPA